ncbi:MAG: hypothetical protein MJ057_05955 [Sphaerochaetaceae bacterium]|nr:hypothetical protein [Sphaerochaetaceae bacterium]
MKRLITAIMTLLLGASVFGANYNTALTKGIQVNGFIKTYCIATITPIESNANSTIGVPFNIMGNDINYQADKRLGREIARWSVATNLSNVKLIFNATPLQSDSDASVSVNYYMTFRLCYDGEDASGNTTTTVDYVTVPSDSQDHVTTITNPTAVDNETLPVISLDQDVRIMLYEYSTAEKEAWPTGYYYGDVVLTLEGA